MAGLTTGPSRSSTEGRKTIRKRKTNSRGNGAGTLRPSVAVDEYCGHTFESPSPSNCLYYATCRNGENKSRNSTTLASSTCRAKGFASNAFCARPGQTKGVKSTANKYAARRYSHGQGIGSSHTSFCREGRSIFAAR